MAIALAMILIFQIHMLLQGAKGITTGYHINLGNKFEVRFSLGCTEKKSAVEFKNQLDGRITGPSIK